jgi:hypothetical protein
VALCPVAKRLQLESVVTTLSRALHSVLTVSDDGDSFILVCRCNTESMELERTATKFHKKFTLKFVDMGSVFESGYGQEFSVLHVVQASSGVHPTSYTMGNGGSFWGVKRPGCETDHSTPTSA